VDLKWKKFGELTTKELYEIVKLRQQVFVVEQNCVYLDTDDLDLEGEHLLAEEDGRLVGYLRITPPASRFPEYSLGRVVVATDKRGLGLGKKLTATAIEHIQQNYGKLPIRISAQGYLKVFYEQFGFRQMSEEYLEDGIPHIEMLLQYHA